MPDIFLGTPALGLQNGHFNQALTNLLIATPQEGFIAGKLLPVLPVLKQSDVYFKFDSKQRAWALSDDRRAPGTLGNTEDYALSYDTYRCEDHALHGFVTAEEIANYDNPLQPTMDKVNFLAQKTTLNEEYGAKAALDAALTAVPFTAALNTDAGQTTVDPYEFINAQINTIRLAIGRRPNVMAMDLLVFMALQAHPAIQDKIKYTGTGDNPAQVTEKTLAELFKLDEVLVSTAVINSAKEGQDASNAALWGTSIYLLYRNPRPALREPSTGYTITWGSPNGVYGGTPMSNLPASVSKGWVVESWVEQKLKREDYRVQKYYTQKIVLTSGGLILTGAIA